MKRLTITYDGRELYDGEVAEFTWTETDSEVTVKGSTKPKPNLVEALQSLSAQARRNGDSGGTE